MQEVILTVGISGSGKTTWAEELCAGNNPFVNINRDDIRFNKFNDGVRDWSKYKFKRSNENWVTERQEEAALQAVELGLSIVISDTNLNAKTRQKWKTFAEDHNIGYKEKVFDITWEEAVKREAQRPGGVGISVLRKQWENYLEYTGRKTYEPNGKRKAVIVDVDGTIAQMNGRGPFDWDKVDTDLPRKEIISMVHGLIDSGVEPVFLSGRSSECSEKTYDWIMENLMHCHCDDDHGFYLFMRSAGDMRLRGQRRVVLEVCGTTI